MLPYGIDSAASAERGDYLLCQGPLAPFLSVLIELLFQLLCNEQILGWNREQEVLSKACLGKGIAFHSISLSGDVTSLYAA